MPTSDRSLAPHRESARPATSRQSARAFSLTDHRRAWISAAALFALALLLRLWNLGAIDELIFDETYYVKDAYSLSRNGVEMAWPDGYDPAFEAGHTDGHLDKPAQVVHPSIGKWLIASGMALFGADNAFGWRVGVAVTGALCVPILMFAARRLFRSTILGIIAGLLLAIDGMHIVLSRTALLDGPLTFFVLAAFAALLIDRDQFRDSLTIGEAHPRTVGHEWIRALRPWRILAGVLLGLACATKWSGLWFLAVFGIMSVLWDWSARKQHGERSWLSRGFTHSGIPAFFSMVGSALVVYVVSWSGWFASSNGLYRTWAEESGNATGIGLIDAFRSLWHYHTHMFSFHVGLTAEHRYSSHPLTWPMMLRPTNFYYRSLSYGEGPCEVAECASHVVALGNPILWWLGTAAIVITALHTIWSRTGRDWVVLSGIIAGLVPWLVFSGRTVFAFYAVVFSPWLVLCVVYVFWMMMQRAEQAPRERPALIAIITSTLALIVLVSAFMWPIWSGEVIDVKQWQWRMWLPTWV